MEHPRTEIIAAEEIKLNCAEIDANSQTEETNILTHIRNLSIRPVIRSLPPILLADPAFIFRSSAISFFTQSELAKLIKITKLSRSIISLTLIDAILSSVLLYFGIYYFLIVTLPLAVIGFLGSRKYNSNLAIVYFIFVLLIIGLRIIDSLIIMPSIAIIIIQALNILFEIYLFFIDLQFFFLLKKITSLEKEYLIRGIITDSNQERIPDNIAVKIIEIPPNLYEVV